jgi:hypothetical protein
MPSTIPNTSPTECKHKYLAEMLNFRNQSVWDSMSRQRLPIGCYSENAMYVAACIYTHFVRNTRDKRLYIQLCWTTFLARSISTLQTPVITENLFHANITIHLIREVIKLSKQVKRLNECEQSIISWSFHRHFIDTTYGSGNNASFWASATGILTQ